MTKVVSADVLEVISEAGIGVDVKDIEIEKELNLQGIDSLDMMNIFFKIEEKYGITIEESAIEDSRWSTVAEIVANINKMLEH